MEIKEVKFKRNYILKSLPQKALSKI